MEPLELKPFDQQASARLAGLPKKRRRRGYVNPYPWQESALNG